jgi:hypothetical protein
MTKRNASNLGQTHAELAGTLVTTARWMAVGGAVVTVATGLILILAFSASLKETVAYAATAGLTLFILAGSAGMVGRALQGRLW